MHPIEQAFHDQKRIGLIPFIMAGDPDLEVTLELLQLLDEEGVTAIELGMPYSDPLADGPVIQEAAGRALAQGISLHQVLAIAAEARRRGIRTPLILFSYLNPILQYGKRQLFSDAKGAGFNGLIIPDLPLEESQSIRELSDEQDLLLIPLVAPTSPPERIKQITAAAQGFVYCVSSAGTTGVRAHFPQGVETFLDHVREQSPVPIAIGFGISGPEHLRQFSPHADAAVVGSALINQLAEKRERLLLPEERGEALEEIRLWLRGLYTESII